ncbi:hypothetical protein BS50DRAFT_605332 [Corynespora cassiicola Philippines]|uniref:Uncharacterized protein n=1 Tax=Corynespora cassiicola Philippines TaxID=1448308 RepID=A0A2T2N120_CORCC|nr:hypothetical protein BS50DRAFT_580238 [Corynespora cassiicola Philippines]PSN59284.1 hypothetical protein BS50DRAFT_605332 [Corynespora cassiicola Philippines]
MSPIARSAVKFTQRIRNSELRNRTLSLIEEATKRPDLAGFTQAVLKNPAHTSHTDTREHVTARLSTAEQANKGVAQTVHIYFDKNGQYDGHQLYQERSEKKEDD